MVSEMVALLLAVGCSANSGLPDNWGIMISAGPVPEVYAVKEWPKGTRLRGYRLDDLAVTVELSVLSGHRQERSPLYGAGDGSASWRHVVGQKVPEDALWVCLPAGWSVRPTSANRGELGGPGGVSGVITSTLREEGMEVILESGSSKQRLYFYLAL